MSKFGFLATRFSQFGPAATRCAFGFSLLFLAAVLILAYWPVLSEVYGRTDDYNAIQYYKFIHWWDNDFTQHGRILLGPLMRIGFSHATALEHIVVVRWAGCLGLIAFAWILHWLLTRNGVPAVLSIGWCTAACLNPGTAIFVAWAVCYPYTWVMAIALLAGCVFPDWSQHSLNRNAKILRSVIALLLLIPVFLIYQPIAAIFMLPSLIKRWLNPAKISWPSYREVLTACVLFCVISAMYLLSYRWLASIHYAGNPSTGRAVIDLTADGILGRWASFAWRSIASWEDVRTGTFRIAWLLLCSTIWLAFLWKTRKAKRSLRFIFNAVLAFTLLNGPLLIIEENVVAYRILVPAYLATTALFWLAVREVLPSGRFVKYGFTAAVIIYLILSTSDILRYGFVQTQQGELKILTHYFQQEHPAPPEKILLILPSQPAHRSLNWLPRRYSHLEYGRVSSIMPANALPILIHVYETVYEISPAEGATRLRFGSSLQYCRPWELKTYFTKNGLHPEEWTIIDAHSILISD